MKYLSFIRHSESYRKQGPPAALMKSMGEYVQLSKARGTLVDTGGLLPSSEGARVRLDKGELTVIDGPFSESKEVIGGWAILEAKDKAHAIALAKEFLELHKTHWPEFDGECEVRPMFEPNMGP